MKIVIDSNIYLSTFIYESTFLQMIISHINRTNLIIQSQQIIQEVLNVISRSNDKNKWELMNKAYSELNLNKKFFYFNNQDIDDSIHLRDVNDKHIVYLAKLSNADYILTADKDLLESKYKEFIITPNQYFMHFVSKIQ